MDNTTRFNQYIQALQQYITREGHAHVPATHTETLNTTTINLGTWVGYMRQRNKNNQLPQNRTDTLNNTIGWTWGPLKPGPATKNARNNEIHNMRLNGQSLSQIADHYQLSRQRVHQIVKRTTTTQ
jgi:hypothetical protein